MQPIQRVAIVGAGNMGSGIAQKTAQEEFDVQMVDREQQWVDRGQGIIRDFLSEAVERRIFSPAQVDAIQGRITGVVGVENTAVDTDLVIEAVFEDFDIKAAVFATLDAAAYTLYSAIHSPSDDVPPRRLLALADAKDCQEVQGIACLGILPLPLGRRDTAGAPLPE